METPNLDGLSQQAIRRQLEGLCASAGFKNSGRLCRFLRYAVEQTLEGIGDTLKEYAIGVEVYDRKHTYSPQQDSIVRTEARRLRDKLKSYYQAEGSEDEVLIFFRVGSYKPIFRKQNGHGSKSAFDEALAHPSASAPTDRPGSTFAVLPFTDLSNVAETAAIAAGMAHELTYRISLTEGCRFISLNSTRYMPASSSELANISKHLDIQQIIYGSVQKHGQHIVIMVHGLNPVTHETWTAKFDAEEHDWNPIRLQQYAASALMARVGPRYSKVRNMEERIRPAAVALYPTLLSAETLLDHCDQRSIRLALKKFERLANGAYRAGRIFCGIAQCHYVSALIGEPMSTEAIADCKSAALRAMEIDREMAESHAALGCAQALELNFEEAEQSFLRALALGHYLAPMQLYAHLLISLGRFDEAYVQLRASHELDPFSGQQKLACARAKYFSGRFREDWCDPSFPVEYGDTPMKAVLLEAKVNIQLGETNEATKLAERVLKKANNSPVVIAEVAQTLAMGGLKEKARTLVEKFKLLESGAAVSKLDQARLYLALEQPDGAERCLAEAVQRKEPQLMELGVDFAFDQVRDTRYFTKLTARLDTRVSAS